MLLWQQDLLAVEEAGDRGYTRDELKGYLDCLTDGVKQRKDTSL